MTPRATGVSNEDLHLMWDNLRLGTFKPANLTWFEWEIPEK